MDTPNDIPVRSARDRVIDLLGMGDTYPLTDLDVLADQLTVAFGGTAKIPIENAQAGVSYQLCDPKGDSLGAAFKAAGNDATLVIQSPKVVEDVTYRILAAKIPAGSTSPAQAARYLNENAPVKVGIDTTLVIEILEVPLLDPALTNPQPSDPRIVFYGDDKVNVKVYATQEGVQYSLVVDGKDRTPSLTGNLHDIVLPVGAVYEDTLIRVRATKTFAASEKRTTETALLDARLYLKVRANPALDVSADPVIEYQQDASIRIARTQPSVKYRAYARAIADADFLHGAAAGDVITVAVAGKPEVQVRKPARPAVWQTPDRCAPAGDAPAGGNAGGLTLAVKRLSEDTMVVVQALKEHRVDANDPASPVITSAVQLDQSAVILVRPDPAAALKLRIPVSGTQTGDTMQVSNGQPGVFYFFRQASAVTEFSRPVYFHKRDALDAAQNKGVGQLAMEVDFAVATDPDARASGIAANPATDAPRAPLLSINPIPVDSGLSSRAVKAQTGVEASRPQTAQLAPVPAIRPEQAAVDSGVAAKIVIPASNPDDQYQVMLNGAAVGPPLRGNQNDLIVTTAPLTADATFEVVVTRPADKGIQVERVVRVPVAVRAARPAG